MRSRGPSTDARLAAVAIASVLALLAASYLTQPRITAFGDLTEGARVAVDARVLDANSGARSQRLMLSDGTHRLPAFAPLDAPVERGDIIDGVGIVSRDEYGLLLSLERIDVRIATAQLIREPVDLARDPEEHHGARVVVAGTIRSGMLEGGGARIALAGDELPREGTVIVTGTFRYHAGTAAYRIWVESWTPRS